MEKKCILIIEDEPDILAVYKEYLESAGFTVDTAGNGEEGLAKLLENKADLVLLDVMMPKLDGIGVLQTVKDQGHKIPPTIMLTNLSHDEALKEAVLLGAKDCCIKSSMTPEELLKKVKNYLLLT